MKFGQNLQKKNPMCIFYQKTAGYYWSTCLCPNDISEIGSYTYYVIWLNDITFTEYKIESGHIHVHHSITWVCVCVCVYACYRPETMSHFNIILSSYYVILCTCHDINTDINSENWPNPRNTICSTILFEYHIQRRTNTDVTILNKRTFSMSN